MQEFEELRNGQLFQILSGFLSLIYNRELNYKSNMQEIIDKWELHILKEDVDDEVKEIPWLIMLRFLFNML